MTTTKETVREVSGYTFRFATPEQTGICRFFAKRKDCTIIDVCCDEKAGWKLSLRRFDVSGFLQKNDAVLSYHGEITASAKWDDGGVVTNFLSFSHRYWLKAALEVDFNIPAIDQRAANIIFAER